MRESTSWYIPKLRIIFGSKQTNIPICTVLCRIVEDIPRAVNHHNTNGEQDLHSITKGYPYKNYSPSPNDYRSSLVPPLGA